MDSNINNGIHILTFCVLYSSSSKILHVNDQLILEETTEFYKDLFGFERDTATKRILAGNNWHNRTSSPGVFFLLDTCTMMVSGLTVIKVLCYVFMKCSFQTVCFYEEPRSGFMIIVSIGCKDPESIKFFLIKRGI